ncbi:hypothetical protein VIBNISFn27_570018 [Vibrio nigripulchritudo SFn27]|uniref:Uncharacterized protein n=1 Tax=Vibrio nigripulchritudo SOn1 TaxID=1238450 RepID=A0AAV2VPB1_9VIBR|nr:hypothetical protein VIBNIAM115_670006 [Vibrio nigripulchritudo AM115]CCN41151.1 hypothetical protein VIBNIFTn2_1480038 [Vibrio nigripulchritudo FTn2]CCN48510.1 hypothetical protein VIBNIMADA3020_60010 [Vibrio nigripulchritudo MADA3020]CCN55622.1 hypothetical protein VIBNIMADA3021_790160 [Vibrio nigripulchritudo MADA3021]CCN67578.1 hypothetical protein VIBNIPon4_820020 [Vibrio nigripulchritudo POn4]CCN73706.1 hypothetical protein VIBNISFn118_910004 [Vibrio nigripulchritudo SFn118]CCN89188.
MSKTKLFMWSNESLLTDFNNLMQRWFWSTQSEDVYSQEITKAKTNLACRGLKTPLSLQSNAPDVTNALPVVKQKS